MPGQTQPSLYIANYPKDNFRPVNNELVIRITTSNDQDLIDPKKPYSWRSFIVCATYVDKLKEPWAQKQLWVFNTGSVIEDKANFTYVHRALKHMAIVSGQLIDGFKEARATHLKNEALERSLWVAGSPTFEERIESLEIAIEHEEQAQENFAKADAMLTHLYEISQTIEKGQAQYVGSRLASMADHWAPHAPQARPS